MALVGDQEWVLREIVTDDQVRVEALDNFHVRIDYARIDESILLYRSLAIDVVKSVLVAILGVHVRANQFCGHRKLVENLLRHFLSIAVCDDSLHLVATFFECRGKTSDRSKLVNLTA